MEENKKNVLVVGAGEMGMTFLEELHGKGRAHIIAVVDSVKTAPGMNLARHLKIPTTDNFQDFINNKGIQMIIHTENNEELEKKLIACKPPGVEMMGYTAAELMYKAFSIHKQTEVMLQESTKIYRTVFENSAVAITVVDRNEYIVSWNKFTEDLFDMQEDDLYLKPVKFLYPENEWRKIRSYRIREKGMQTHLETKAIKKNGEYFDVDISISVLKDHEGVITGAIGIMRDISERKKAERKLQIAEEKYRTIFENSAVAITVVDRNECIISWNKFTEDLFDMRQKDLYLRPVKSLYPEDEWQKIRSYHIRENGMQPHLETKAIKNNGELFDVDISISVLKDEMGSITGAVGIMRDITERKKTEEHLQEVYRIKSEFTSMVSHELRTPLTALKESIGIVLDKSAGGINEEQEDFLKTAKRNVDRLARLINDVLDYQRLDMGKMKFSMASGNINSLVDEVVESMLALAESRGLSMNVYVERDLPEMDFDWDKITQVVTNLVDNAIKFTKEGSIDIITKRIENTVCVSVKDTGIGIEKKNMHKLFESFSQVTMGKDRKTGSTGLGLAISKAIIEHHRGKIFVESKYGKGSVFSFVLPVKERRQ